MARRRAQHTVAIALFAAALIGGCANADFKLHVRNETDQAWLVRVPMGGADNLLAVRRIEPASDGIAAAWSGDRNVSVELLDQQCGVVGVFQSADGAEYLVDGVAGVIGTLSPFNRLTDSWNDPDITAIEECGGAVTR